MNKKQLFSLLIILLVQVGAFAQARNAKNSAVAPIISEYDISRIDATEGIDIILQQGESEGLNVQVNNEGLKKLRIHLKNGKLTLSKQPGLAYKERITVYININGAVLETMKLSGDAFVTSKGVLNIHDMVIDIKDDAKVALRTRGKLKVNVPENYEILQEEKYYSVYASGK